LDGCRFPPAVLLGAVDYNGGMTIVAGENWDAVAAAGRVKSLAREAGFDLVGIAPVVPAARAEAYRAWIAAGKHGQMQYLAGNLDERLDLRKKLPWAKSVVCVALAYDAPGEAGGAEAEGATGKIAKYAVGRDYHAVFEKRLKALEKLVRAQVAAEFSCRTWSDAQPIVERDFALWAGLGWIGKNTLVIHPRHGSFFLLGELITSLELTADVPMGDHCGTCTRCIEACPTGAIEPYSVDGSKCISYLTIEHRGEIAGEFHGAMREAGFIVGCDICQDVCPFNRQPLGVTNADLRPQGLAARGGVVSLPVIKGWDEQAWDVATRGKAYRRVKLGMWQRNAGILEGG
jgi:epoxyqueuosine reductase